MAWCAGKQNDSCGNRMKQRAGCAHETRPGKTRFKLTMVGNFLTSEFVMRGKLIEVKVGNNLVRRWR